MLMADKFVKTRVQMKRGLESDWITAEANGFLPLEGEYIFYTDLNKIKVGKKDNAGNLIPLSQLAFTNANDADTLDGKHASDFVLKTDTMAPADAEKNVQSDWNVTDTSSDAYIKNKPNVIVEGDTRLTDARTPKAHNQAATTITEDTTHRFVTDTEKAAWNAKSNFSGNYDDLTGKPTIPVVNNATLTIQKNGTNVAIFTSNSASNATANITVPTKVSDLNNDAGYLTSYTESDPTVPSHVKSITSQDITNWNAKSNFSGNYNDLTNKPAIPTKASWNYDDAYVKYATAQSLTDAQKATARSNIGAGTSSFSGNYTDLTNKPTIPADTNQTVKTGSVTFEANEVVEFVAGANVSITGDKTNKKITISSTDTNTETTLTITDKTDTDTAD
jgi:hypothetical protein